MASKKQKKNIVICWNDNGYADKLNKAFSRLKDYSVTVFTSFEFFDKLGKSDQERKLKLNEYDGFAVLCELQWDHETTGADFSEFQGVSFVQGYLRRQLGLKAPVVFTSFMDAKEIVKQKPVYSIIMTPALQHVFVRLPSQPEALVEPFAKMRFMSDTELVYTQMQYCDFKGLLGQIKHNATGRNSDEQQPYRQQLEYVINNLFKDRSDFEKLIIECRTTETINVFCDRLIAMFDNTSKTEDLPEFYVTDKREQIKILLIEDEAEKDSRIQSFINYLEEKNKCNAHGHYYIFGVPNIAKTPSQILEIKEKNLMKTWEETRETNVGSKVHYNDGFYISEHNVIICDIELRNENGELTVLGFNLFDEIIQDKLFYIVTNVTRNVFDLLKMQGINRVRLKEDVFGTEEKIKAFLWGIFDVLQEKKKRDEQKCVRLFNKLSLAVTNSYYYPISIKDETLENYQQLESYVKKTALGLINVFLNICSEKLSQELTIKSYDRVCYEMRDYISQNIGLANESLIEEIANRGFKIKQEDIDGFVVRLVLRRFFMYLRRFIEYHHIVDLYETARKKYKQEHPNEEKCSSKYSSDDLACRAISSQFKQHKHTTQSRCLDRVLLFPAVEKKRKWLTEEEMFDAFLNNGSKIFDYSNIANLDDYVM